MYWSNNDLPIIKLIETDLSALNEEAGEILLSMLATIRSRSDIGRVEELSRQMKEVVLRYEIARAWEENFAHTKREYYHRQIRKTDVEINVIIEHFRSHFLLMTNQ